MVNGVKKTPFYLLLIGLDKRRLIFIKINLFWQAMIELYIINNLINLFC